MDEKERARALSATLSQIEKQFGKGSVIRLGGQPVQAVPAISTGSISVDFALGIGGCPRGRISEMRPRGNPPMPSAKSTEMDPVEITGTADTG